jgi:hypothetical protein
LDQTPLAPNTKLFDKCSLSGLNRVYDLGDAETVAKAAKKSKNEGLGAAKAAKKDEFYTQYVDIQKEVEAYLEFNPDTFRGKVVYCNCDDPFESNFFKYFAANFNRLGLKRLISTSYDGSPIAGEQLRFNVEGEDQHTTRQTEAIAVEIDEVVDLNEDGATDLEDVKLFLENNPHTRTRLAGGGDFRSAECLELLNKADIVVTNPPFSLFKEYVALLVEHGKQFLIIGNLQAVTYLEIFPLIKANKLWLGPTITSGDREFRVPDYYPLEAAGSRIDDNGVKYIRVKGVRWYTNLDHGRRHDPLECMTLAENLRYSSHKQIRGKAEYEKYYNLDALEVPFGDAIPSDYDGLMGVPVSFLDKYNPDQFEIIGNSDDGTMMRELGVRPLGPDFIDAYRANGGTGHYSQGMRMLGLMEPHPRVIYKRILIRRRKVDLKDGSKSENITQN